MQILAGTLRKLTDLRWLNLFEVEYKHESGKRGKWHFASRKQMPPLGPAPLQPDAVFIVPILKTPQGNRLVVLKEFRVPLGDYEYSFPAGLQEPGETIESTVRRELAEETGLELTRILATSPPVVASAGMADESAAITFVECSGTPDSSGSDGTEEIEILLLDFKQLLTLRQSTVKFSAKAWLILLMFEALGDIVFPWATGARSTPISSPAIRDS
jgi:ADP-ribose pyrophosphatase